MKSKKTPEKNLVITAILILLFLGWYIYYNTSLIYLPINLAKSQSITIGKYLKCAHEGEKARANDNDADMPAYCCGGLHTESRYISNSSIVAMPGDILTCDK